MQVKVVNFILFYLISTIKKKTYNYINIYQITGENKDQVSVEEGYFFLTKRIFFK